MIMGNNTRWRRTPLLMKYSNKNLYATNWLHRTLWSWFVHLPKALAKLWFTTFVKTAPCQTWKSLTKLRSQYCLDIASKHWKDLLQTQLQCNIFSSCNPLPFNNCELSLPLRLPDYVSHSLVKMLSQTKLIVLPLQTKTNRHPNKNQCKIIWLSLFAKQKPFRDYFLWLFSVIIFRDYFFSSHPNNKPCKEMQRVMLFHYESKQYASISLQNYLTSLLTSRNLSVIIFYSHFNN